MSPLLSPPHPTPHLIKVLILSSPISIGSPSHDGLALFETRVWKMASEVKFYFSFIIFPEFFKIVYSFKLLCSLLFGIFPHTFNHRLRIRLVRSGRLSCFNFLFFLDNINNKYLIYLLKYNKRSDSLETMPPVIAFLV